ncbi:MAG: hypothetical protein PHU33_14600, partial [Bacteroidales bacterium]|nr:hypothetical protein [Bacteroidales bacterium]
MMQDRDIKFNSTVSAFEKYWQNRPITKGCGWKVFKRWEYINALRVGLDGKIHPNGYVAEIFQKNIAEAKSASGNWTELGPVNLPSNSTSQPNGLGRVNGVAFHPSDPLVIYACSPSGGLWKTSNGGTSWNCLTSEMPTLGTSTMVIDPTATNTLYLGTGDRDAGDAPGLGVYKSTDGGLTWNQSNSGMGNLTIGMLKMHPENPGIILAATSNGIYKTIDGGASWIRKSSNTSHYKDIQFKPGDPSIVYATQNGYFYRSLNTGETWTQITDGIVSGTRMVIGVSTANPSVVYLLQTDDVFAGLLRSTNSGESFSIQATTPNIMDYECDGSGTGSQAWYDLCIAVDPSNAETIYCGGINIWKSINGGVTLTINSHWVGNSWGYSCAPSVHADIHSLDINPLDGKLYSCGDGGLYVTSNGGSTWIDISSGLAIAQVYKIGQSATSSALVMNGYQDNGTSIANGTSFSTIIGGDGMECIIDYNNSNYRYGALYYGDIRRSAGGSFTKIAGNGTNGVTESGGWVTPYLLHETTPTTMFIGYKNVWRSNNVRSSPPSWSQISTGETTNCIALEQSPANTNILYAVRSGSLKRTDNCEGSGVLWTTCALPGGYTPTDLEAHPTNPNVVYATAGYGVYKSIDKGSSWTSISNGLPSLYTNCLVYDKNSDEGIYLGNESAVYYKEASMSAWVLFNSGLPAVDIRELEIYYDANNNTNNLLRAATYGRGLWTSQLRSLPVATTAPATSVMINSAQLNGSINPNGIVSTYFFQYGATTSYGSTTPVVSAGSGSSAVSVSANISGLTPGQTYHFRIVATNTDGTAYGSDLSFTTGAPSITTAAISSIGLTTAQSGGTISSDGGSAITVRGVCWGTSASPVVSGNHTTDGTGTGSFTSSITGLTSNTT